MVGVGAKNNNIEKGKDLWIGIVSVTEMWWNLYQELGQGIC